MLLREALRRRMIALGVIGYDNAKTTKEFATALAEAPRGRRYTEWMRKLHTRSKTSKTSWGEATYAGLFQQGVPPAVLYAAEDKYDPALQGKVEKLWYVDEKDQRKAAVDHELEQVRAERRRQKNREYQAKWRLRPAAREYERKYHSERWATDPAYRANHVHRQRERRAARGAGPNLGPNQSGIDGTGGDSVGA